MKSFLMATNGLGYVPDGILKDRSFQFTTEPIRCFIDFFFDSQIVNDELALLPQSTEACFATEPRLAFSFC
ncbi:hypothetical protein EMN47_20265 [Prolixibacteraceae bacterium JC049]|nr:hypothetical protein [Prolixibacteraceae bacterium JC049]